RQSDYVLKTRHGNVHGRRYGNHFRSLFAGWRTFGGVFETRNGKDDARAKGVYGRHQPKQKVRNPVVSEQNGWEGRHWIRGVGASQLYHSRFPGKHAARGARKRADRRGGARVLPHYYTA